MAQARIRMLFLMAVAGMALTACVGGGNPFKRDDSTEGTATAAATSTRLVDRDVEAPEVFQTTDEALWDGRPSLGGVWVASPDAKDPERVIIRNAANGKFVIGALFRREIDNPGPKLQISSDAAAALGMLAGAPATVNVTALRRDEADVQTDATRPILDASETVDTSALDPATGITAAGDGTASSPAVTTPTAVAPTVSGSAAAAPASDDTGRSIQIGIFSVEANATRASETLRAAGLAATVSREQSQGRALWSVMSRGDAAVLAQVKGLGFPDAYFAQR